MSGLTVKNDLGSLSDDELNELRQAVGVEIERRVIIANARDQADRIAKEYSEAVGRVDGAEWAQPTGAHDAYPLGAIVTHGGRVWENVTPANVWEPGVSGWREQATSGPGEGDADGGAVTAPVYVQPTGAHDAYKKGDRVLFNGVVYESTIDGNVWTPDGYPTGWVVVS